MATSGLRPAARPPAISLALTSVWKLVEWLQGVDFVLSVANRPTGDTLQIVLADYGPWVWMLVSGLWLWNVMRAKPSSRRPSGWLYALAGAVPSFALGAIVMASVGNQARTLLQHVADRANGNCHAIIDTSRLARYADDYRLHLVCGATDSAVDRKTDEQIVLGGARTITGGNDAITVPIPAVRRDWFYRHGQWWVMTVLIPEGRDIARIKNLSDVEANKGIVLKDFGAAGTNTVTPSASDKAAPVLP